MTLVLWINDSMTYFFQEFIPSLDLVYIVAVFFCIMGLLALFTKWQKHAVTTEAFKVRKFVGFASIALGVYIGVLNATLIYHHKTVDYVMIVGLITNFILLLYGILSAMPRSKSNMARLRMRRGDTNEYINRYMIISQRISGVLITLVSIGTFIAIIIYFGL